MAKLDFEKSLDELHEKISHLRDVLGRDSEPPRALAREVNRLMKNAEGLRRDVFADLGVWQKVLLSRHPDRPYFLDYASRIFDDLLELHGDRLYGDDPAIVSGFAKYRGQTVCFVAHQKGRTTKEKVHRNFGMAHPEGYRKAMRIMELAGRFHRPVFTFIDTPGAYPGLGAEERGQSEAIGKSLAVMSQLPVPVIATVIGEGGSGGALALGVANRVLMLEYATYSVITPEGCASILWRDGAQAPKAAEQLGLLPTDAMKNGIVDTIIPEPVGGAHRDIDEASKNLDSALSRTLEELQDLKAEALIEDRYRRFRAIGKFKGA